MPTYQYRCESCFTILERRQSFDEEPLAICPSCGRALRRVLSPASLIFKGSGWYSTDSRASGDSAKSTVCSGCEKEPTCESAKRA